ncbi:MAG TPA: ABC transporter ATP-binding protein [Oscillospiraceae bacterium]|nr:ABC transporter ATP-binding protein [Oscillospiraceae bacterium]HRW56216.1 ABC transporter ATP-binding protein [Oscillospiraceae bacterium]
MQTTKKKRNLTRFLPYYKPYLPTMALDLLCALLTTICEIVLPILVRKITNTATTDLALLTPRLILSVAGIYILLRIIDTAANYYMIRVGHMMGARLETDMRNDLFSHLQELSFSFYSNTKVGQLMSRITRDLFDITEFSHHCPEEVFIALLKFVASFLILANVNLTLTVIIYAMIPLMAIFVLRMQAVLGKAFTSEKEQIGRINAQVEDSLLGIRVVKSFSNEEIEKEKFREGNHTFLDIKNQAYIYLAQLHCGIRFFDGMMYILVVTAGAFFMMSGKISVGDFVAYLLYTATLLATVSRLAEFTETFMQGLTGINRFFEIMDVQPEITDSPDAESIGEVTGDIVFDHVTFRYEDSGSDVLSGIDLHVCPGENVALIGPSGGGKTTLSNLIPRFYDVTAGRILLDGKDIRKVTLKSLRANIGVVQQEVYLFSGSVYENILYGKPDASREEVVEAAKLAGADDFINALPDGYDTYVGERGVKLSGGQKQRISIARVFLKNPPVLILDEATSALDNESEHVVQQSLERLSKGRTVFTIAHRLSTIRSAKIILVLTKDGIVEQGSHDELMAEEGVYYNLQKISGYIQ